MTFSKYLPYPYFYGLGPTISAISVISSRVEPRYFLGFVKLGLISYPLYLWHWVIFSFAYIYIGKQPNFISMLMAILLSILLAFLTERYIERVRYSRHKNTVIYLMLCFTCTALLARVFIDQEGLNDRGHIAVIAPVQEQLILTKGRDSQCISYVSSQNEGSKVSFDYCRSAGEYLPQKIAVIGDSHAHTLFPGLPEEAKKHDFGVVAYGNSGCPPLIGFSVGGSKVVVR